MITTLAATIALVLLAAAVVLGVGRAIVHALRDAGRRVDTILEEERGRPDVDEELAEQQLRHRPGDDDQFTRWAAVRTHEDA